MSNPTKIYNDYVRANLPNTMTFNSSTARYNINNHSFFSFNRANWYFKYITKYGYISLSAYAVNNFDPDLVFDFKQNYYRTGGTATTLSPAVTHARAGNATMVDSDGLLKWAPHNLLTYSQDFSSWPTSPNVTITSNTTIAPDGTTTADSAVFDGNANARVEQSITQTGSRVLAVWMKVPSGTQGVYIGFTSGDLSLVTVTDQWVLYSYESASGAYPRINCSDIATVHIWGAHAYQSDLGMVNNSATGNSYVPTTSSAVYLPRLGHHVYNGTAWVNEGILHESEARTNLVAYSSNFTQASWTKFRVGITENVSGVTGPDGTQTVDKITPIATDEQHRVWYGVSSTAVGETYSVYAKSAGYNYVWVGYYENPVYKYAIVNLTNGAVTSSNAANYSVEDVGNGFYRISVTKTTSGSSRYISIAPSPTASPTLDGNGAPVYLGDGTSGVYVYGAQIEAGSTPSSYIPTSGSTVTRAAETLTVPAANLPYSSTNMSIQMDGKMTYADRNIFNEVLFTNWISSGTDYIQVGIHTADVKTGQLFFKQNSLGSVSSIFTAPNHFNPNIGVPFNIASRHGSTFINGAINGTTLTANTTPTSLPDLSSTDLNLGSTFMGTIGKFRVWDEDLTDTGIVEAST